MTPVLSIIDICGFYWISIHFSSLLEENDNDLFGGNHSPATQSSHSSHVVYHSFHPRGKHKPTKEKVKWMIRPCMIQAPQGRLISNFGITKFLILSGLPNRTSDRFCLGMKPNFIKQNWKLKQFDSPVCKAEHFQAFQSLDQSFPCLWWFEFSFSHLQHQLLRITHCTEALRIKCVMNCWCHHRPSMPVSKELTMINKCN